MIVRDEESTLQRCLESARPFIDEIVVVDTGSTDATPRIARAAGARVVRTRAGRVGVDLNPETRIDTMAFDGQDWNISLKGRTREDRDFSFIVEASLRAKVACHGARGSGINKWEECHGEDSFPGRNGQVARRAGNKDT